MLCNLAVHLTEDGSCTLRITGRTALGPSGTGGRDSKHYSSADDLLSDLKTFGLGPEVAGVAAKVLRHPEARTRFIDIAEDVQIPFETLERADVYLFD